MLAVVWHFWIAVALMIPIVLITVGLVGQYLHKTQRPRYPRSDQQ